MGPRGRSYVSTERLAVLSVSALLLCWGLLWVLHVTQYGLCQQELTGAVDRLTSERRDLAAKAEEETKEVWRLAQATEDAFQEVDRAKAAWASVKVPLIVPCTNKAVLAAVPYGQFILYPLTSESRVDACVNRLQLAGASPFVGKLQIVKTAGGGDPAEGDMAFLASGINHVKAGLAPTDTAGFAVVSDTVQLSPEAFEVLYAAGRQAAALFAGPDADLCLVTPCGQPPPAAAPLSSMPLSPSFSHVFSRGQVGVPRAFVTTVSRWVAVAPAFKSKAVLVSAASPVVDRCRSAQAAAPVLFSAIDLSYLSSGAAYHDWLARFTRSMNIENAGHISAVALDATGDRPHVLFLGDALDDVA
ncbi:hypothetical protein DIPPA_08437 [Diplonema papillatum]|nr:hypothetical protein DIPPA_08437 [Diplonema papillatum]